MTSDMRPGDDREPRTEPAAFIPVQRDAYTVYAEFYAMRLESARESG